MSQHTQTEQLSNSITTYGVYGQYEADLNAFDPIEFPIPDFKTNYKASIDAVIAAATDETVRDMKKQLSEAEIAARQACQNDYIQGKYFIEKAFRGNKAVLHEFGSDNNESARRNSTVMLVFMDTLHTKVVKYQTELTAVGFPTALVTSLVTTRNALFSAYDANRSFFVERSDTTIDRETAYTTMWSFTMSVIRAGQTLYATNPAKKAQFTLPAPVHNHVHPIKPEATIARFPKKLTKTTKGGFHNHGTIPLIIYAAKEVLKDLPKNALQVSAGDNVKWAAADLSDDGVFDTLFIFNPDTAETGKYAAELD